MSKKSDKFYVYAAKKSGFYKGKRLLGVNLSWEGDVNSLTLQDLIEFLNEKNIDLSTVVLPPAFTTFAKV